MSLDFTINFLLDDALEFIFILRFSSDLDMNMLLIDTLNRSMGFSALNLSLSSFASYQIFGFEDFIDSYGNVGMEILSLLLLLSSDMWFANFLDIYSSIDSSLWKLLAKWTLLYICALRLHRWCKSNIFLDGSNLVNVITVRHGVGAPWWFTLEFDWAHLLEVRRGISITTWSFECLRGPMWIFVRATSKSNQSTSAKLNWKLWGISAISVCTRLPLACVWKLRRFVPWMQSEASLGRRLSRIYLCCCLVVE